MDLQFMDETLRVGFGPDLAVFQVLCSQAFFSAAPSFDGDVSEVRFCLHDMPFREMHGISQH
jgi:hypothetical protein